MKKFLALILALVMSLSLVACGSEETTDEGATDGDTAASELNVGVFYYNYSDAYITTVRNAMDALLEEAGITYNNYDGAGNQATQLDQINTAISNGANLLVVNIVETSSPDAAQNAVEAAKTAGIPIIFFNREVSGSFRENILSKGGTEHPMELYVRFRGHKPETKALIEKMGLGK